jgi:hypothetical protein
MSARDLYEQLLDPTTAAPEDQATAALLAELRALRTARREGLAWAEYAEGVWTTDEPDAEVAAPERLAAESAAAVDFPATYTDGACTLVIGLGLDGTPYLALDAAPSVLTVRVDGASHTLSPDQEIHLHELIAPPRQLQVQYPDGTLVTLTAS